MTALLLHTTLSVVLLAWAYMVTSRIPYRPAWIWTGSALVVVVGYVSLLARSVFEGSPARVQGVVATIGAVLLALSAIACFVLYGLVSRGPRRPAARGATRADVSEWAPREDESVISPVDAEWDEGPVIDAGTWPSGADGDEAPRGGRYAYASADEPEAPAAPAPARSMTPPVVPPPAPAAADYRPAPPAATYRPAPPDTYRPVPPDTYRPVPPAAAPPVAPAPSYQPVPPRAAPPVAPSPSPYQPVPPAAASATTTYSPFAPPPAPQTSAPQAPAHAPAVYQPVAPPPVGPSEWPAVESADEDAWDHVAPRRAMPSPSDMGS